MQRKVERRLKFATVLLILSGYFGLTTTFSYGPDILLVPVLSIALMPVGEWLDRKYGAYRRATSVVILLFIGVFFLILRRFTLLDAVIALVMFIQVYSVVHVKHSRNYIHLFLMSFFLMLAAAVMAPRPEIALVFVLFLASLTWAMTLLEMFSAARAAQAGPGGGLQWRSSSGEIIPARFVRLFDLRLTTLLGVTMLGMIVVTVLMFTVGPRTEAGVFGSAPPPEQATTTVSSEVDLSGGIALQSNATPVMRVQFPQEAGGQYRRAMLWRVTALDAYTGGGWQHRGLVTQGYVSHPEMRRLKSDSRLATREGLDRPECGWRQVYYELYLDRPPHTGVPLLQLVKQATPGPESARVQFRWDYANDFSVVLSSRNENGVYIRAYSEIIEPSVQRLREARMDFDGVMAEQDFVQLTYHDLLPQTLDLVERLTRNQPSPYDKIRALERYLNGPDFEYSRLVPVLPDDNPVDAFILRERRGHCQLYASALALMVRSLGLPTRLVSGYRGGTWEEGDRSYTITEDMAHLWTEVYFPNVGWITFDPSPLDQEPDGLTIGAISRTYSRFVLKARMLWLRNVIAYERERHGDSMRAMAGRVFRAGRHSWDSLQSHDHRVALTGIVRIPVLLFVLVLACGLMAWFVSRGRRRGTRVRATPLSADQRRAVRLRRRIARKLRRMNITCVGRTAEELADAASALHFDDPDVLPVAIALYNGARFGQRPLASGELKMWARRIDALRLDAAKF